MGDPVNAVRIFNEKEVDELVFLDVLASKEGKGPNFALISDIASEAFMPLAYGGGISNVEQVRQLFNIGVEKVVLNSAVASNFDLVSAAAKFSGSQSVVVSIDVRRSLFGKYTVHTHGGSRATGTDPVEHAKRATEAGAGEILLTAIDRDGTQSGYDLELLTTVSNSVSVPVVACGGAGSVQHLREAVKAGASAVAAGSMFVFHGKHRAVLITYPDRSELEELLECV